MMALYIVAGKIYLSPLLHIYLKSQAPFEKGAFGGFFVGSFT